MDEVDEHIEEGEGVFVDDSDGEDNESVDDGPADDFGERICVWWLQCLWWSWKRVWW